MLIVSILLSSALAADFECDPVVSPIYPDLGEFAFHVSGTLLPRRAQPTYIVVSHQDDGEVLAERAHPPLFNDYDGGYWLDTYGLNTWRAGRWGTTQFYFLLGTEPVDETFSAQLHLDSGSGGSYAQAMDCRITS
jgi:hypothetical protein